MNDFVEQTSDIFSRVAALELKQNQRDLDDVTRRIEQLEAIHRLQSSRSSQRVEESTCQHD